MINKLFLKLALKNLSLELLEALLAQGIDIARKKGVDFMPGVESDKAADMIIDHLRKFLNGGDVSDELKKALEMLSSQIMDK
jgi:hypothetical protein